MYLSRLARPMTCGHSGQGSFVVVAENQCEQIALFVGQRRKRVHHLLDVGGQLLFVVAARGTPSAALAWPCRCMRGTGLIRAIGGTGRAALTSDRDGRPATGRGGRDDALGRGRPSLGQRPGQTVR